MTNIWKWVAGIAFVLSAVSLYMSLPATTLSLGGVGPNLIENYMPLIRYNGGLKTALPVAASSTLQVTGKTTAYATTTVDNGLNLFNTAGFCVNFYATSSATELHLVASTTGTLPHGAAAAITANYGACGV